MSIININDNLTTRIIPEYDDEVAIILFVNEAEFEEWFSNIAQKHANWNLHQSWTNEKAGLFLGQPLAAPLRLNTIKYQCDHAGKPKKRKESEVSTKKARTKESIKIGCPAYINKHLLTDGAVEVKYRWKHPDHNPCEVQEIISYRLPSEVKQ
ncbi:hypothetical protein CU097_003539 [Rhizopus azygosporus]|uniref:FAR1 domain-containing protein n=1 Tax=Rhizopus azygosporus TaxID=86630 RepID=A0A367K0A9_RHIAZ|nr:hypothetical protein CU097_003539 [Rhizopus azygosporus]